MAFDVLIVDDSRPFLDAAREVLERQGLRIVGLASTSSWPGSYPRGTTTRPR